MSVSVEIIRGVYRMASFKAVVGAFVILNCKITFNKN